MLPRAAALTWGVKDEVKGLFGACVVADAPSSTQTTTPGESTKPSETADPSEPADPTGSEKPTETEKPEDPVILPGASEAECKAAGGKIDMGVKDPKTGLFGACVLPEKPKPTDDPSETEKTTNPSESESPTSGSKEPSSAAPTTSTKPGKKGPGGLALTGVSVGGLVLAAAALVGAGIYLVRRRQNV